MALKAKTRDVAVWELSKRFIKGNAVELEVALLPVGLMVACQITLWETLGWV